MEAQRICRQTFISAPTEQVWEALTDDRLLAEWFANEVVLDLRLGGTGVFRWDDGSERRAVVEEIEPNRRFAFRWFEAEDAGAETVVELTLDETPDGTYVNVVESFPATGPAARAGILAGEWSWGIELLAALPRLRRPARV